MTAQLRTENPRSTRRIAFTRDPESAIRRRKSPLRPDVAVPMVIAAAPLMPPSVQKVARSRNEFDRRKLTYGPFIDNPGSL